MALEKAIIFLYFLLGVSHQETVNGAHGKPDRLGIHICFSKKANIAKTYLCGYKMKDIVPTIVE